MGDSLLIISSLIFFVGNFFSYICCSKRCICIRLGLRFYLLKLFFYYLFTLHHYSWMVTYEERKYHAGLQNGRETLR